MMEMDDRESAMCQNPREGTWMAFLELFNEDETKECIVVFFFFKIGDQNVGLKMNCKELGFDILERESVPSL